MADDSPEFQVVDGSPEFREEPLVVEDSPEFREEPLDGGGGAAAAEAFATPMKRDRPCFDLDESVDAKRMRNTTEEPEMACDTDSFDTFK